MIDELASLTKPSEDDPNYEIKIQTYLAKSETYAAALEEITNDRNKTSEPIIVSYSSLNAAQTKSEIDSLNTSLAGLEKLKVNGEIPENVYSELKGEWKTQIAELNDHLDALEKKEPVEVEVKVKTTTDLVTGTGPFDSEAWFKYIAASAAEDAEGASKYLARVLQDFFGKSMEEAGIDDTMVLDIGKVQGAISDLLNAPEQNKSAESLDDLIEKFEELKKKKEELENAKDNNLISDLDYQAQLAVINTEISTIITKIDIMTGKAVGLLGLDNVVSEAKKAKDALDDINNTVMKDKTVNVITRYTSTGTPTTGTANAAGSPSTAAGKQLVGEVKPEIVVDTNKGTYQLVSSPTLMDLPQGAMIFNGDETEKILAGKQVGTVGGKAYAGGLSGVVNWIANTVRKVTSTVTGSGKTITTSNTKSTKKSTNKSSKTTSSSADDLFDWIEVRLEKLSKDTEDLINQADRLVGYEDRNARLSDALRATAVQLTTSEQAYTKYMAQADAVAKKTKLSADIISKIQDGSLDLSKYSKATQDKIKQYQEWYDKAQDVKDSILEINDQQKELAATKLDNIISQYENLVDRMDASAEYAQSLIDLKKATGEQVTTEDFNVLLGSTTDKIAKLQEQRRVLSNELTSMVSEGLIAAGSEAWYEYTSRIEDVDKSIITTQIDLQSFKDEIETVKVDKLKASATTLDNAVQSLQSLMTLRETQGLENTETDYATLVDLGMQQINNILEQNKLLNAQLVGLDPLSEKYQEIQSQLFENQQTIMSIKTQQEEWNDAALDLRIAALQKQKDDLQKTNDLYQRQLALQQAIEDVEKARQRTAKVYVAGQGFVNLVDQKALQTAQDALDQKMHEETLNKIDDAIDALEDLKSTNNIYNADGIPQFDTGGIIKKSGLANVHKDEWILNRSQQDSLMKQIKDSYSMAYLSIDALKGVGTMMNSIKTSGTNAPSLSLSLGDITVTGVQDSNEFAKAIHEQFPNAMLQELYKN